jgi:hypothetical protein
MNESTPTPAPTAPITPAPAVTSLVEPNGQNGVSASEAALLAEWAKQDLLSGKITQTQADQQFAELNTPMEQRTTEDLRTDEMKLLDQHFPVAKLEDYLIRYGGPGEDVPMTGARSRTSKRKRRV